jgi:putative ABC transport system permease protein
MRLRPVRQQRREVADRPFGRRVRLSLRDALEVALLGPLSRRSRAALSALGIAVGIAALIAITGTTSSQQAQLRADLDAMGANLLVVKPGTDAAKNPIPLPRSAPEMIRRIGPVTDLVSIRTVIDARVYRTDLVPASQSGGLSAAVVDGDLLATLSIAPVVGRWFDAGDETLPTTVLGDTAARRLGITDLSARPRVWIEGQWYAVIGILEPAGLAASVDSMAFLASRWAPADHGAPEIDSVYVRSATGEAEAIRSVLAATAHPANPRGVAVSSLSDLAQAQEVTENALSSLVLGLAAIALIVGGIGIANTMIVAVLERRGEIGLRRALGARTGQIATQFVLEAALLGVAGGVAGTLFGILAVVGITTGQHTMLALDLATVAAGPGVAAVIGALAGAYPAVRAARLPPNTALRAV